MINWSNIDTVLLDMDGTLLDLHFDNYFWSEHLPQKYAIYRNISTKNARQLIEQMSTQLRGTLNWYCIDHWSAELDIDIQRLKLDISHLICFRPQATDFLHLLKKLGKKRLLVTNAHPQVLQLKATATNLHTHLDQAISSHNFGLAKENHGFWSRLSLQEDLDLSRCLFLDDSPAVLHRARKEGVQYVLQMLQPDSTQPPTPAMDFPAIVHFSELLTL